MTPDAGLTFNQFTAETFLVKYNFTIKLYHSGKKKCDRSAWTIMTIIWGSAKIHLMGIITHLQHETTAGP